jgi:hypothetical protein
MISFSTVDGSQLLDWIPLSEITSIECVETLDRRNPSIFRESKSLVSLNAVFNSRSSPAPSGRSGSSNRNSGEGSGTVFEIETALNGCNSGRRYQMRCRCEDDQVEWVTHIRQAWQEVLAEQEAALRVGFWLRSFRRAKQAAAAFYGSRGFKTLLVLVLAANFFMLMGTAQLQPEPGTPEGDAVDRLEYTFTAIFTAELLLNIFVNWFRPFIADM